VDGWLAGLVAAELGLDTDVVVDADTHEAYLDGTRVELTDLESRLLASLQQRRGKAVSRATLLDEVWGYEDDYSSNVVDVVVRRLRQKLGERSAMLETVRGVGYRWGS
jgi:DNA-binding response OmpR family regulator